MSLTLWPVEEPPDLEPTLRAHNCVPNCPFVGLTREKAGIINSALAYRRVLVGGGKHAADRAKLEEYLFMGMFLPPAEGGTFVNSVWMAAGLFDMQLVSMREDHTPMVGSSRILSPSLVDAFVLIEAPELSYCVQCGGLFPQSQLRDTAYPAWDIQGYGLECKACWRGDY